MLNPRRVASGSFPKLFRLETINTSVRRFHFWSAAFVVVVGLTGYSLLKNANLAFYGFFFFFVLSHY